MIRRGLLPVAAAAGVLLAPAASRATPLDIPAAAPPQFRAMLRAKLHTSERRSSAMTRIELEPQHGYRLMVIGEGNMVAFVVMKEANLLSLLLDSKKAVSRTASAYVTRGTVTPTRIEGSFGRFGSVAMRFRPPGRTTKGDPRRCLGHSHYLTRRGVFAGHLRFSGENGYVRVRAHRARGRVRTPRHLRCRRGIFIGAFLRQRSSRHATRESSGDTEAELVAERRTPTDSTELLAFQLPSLGPRSGLALLLALQEESGKRMAVVRYGLTFARGSILSHDDALTSATLRPPRPFHGKGVYSAAPDGTKTWGGSLSIALPGVPQLPLTGPEFATELEVGF